ncbi:hypothetical protein J5X84_07880 [Streptosporangiaceae bacterium NEAU-GS5]|nr:hypothetical protein [Streptosporangiaceae bacterium NEAU-GS5]
MIQAVADLLTGALLLGVPAACGLAAVSILLFAWLLRALTAASAPAVRASRSRLAASRLHFVRLGDPDTPGHARPRAPSHDLVFAAQ